jgi:hypothetical protein
MIRPLTNPSNSLLIEISILHMWTSWTPTK